MGPSIFEAGQQGPVEDETFEEMNAAPQADEVEARRADVEQTRCTIAGTLGEIRDKLDPPTLMQEAKRTVVETAAEVTGHAREAVREATIGRAQEAMGSVMDTARGTGETFMDTVRENPIPAAMIGIGLGWLFMSRRRHEQYMDQYRYGRSYGPNGIYHRPFPDDYHARYEGAGGYGRGYAGGYSDQGGGMRERAGEVAGAVQERAGQVAETVQQRAAEVADTVQERTSEFRDQLQDRAVDMREQFVDRADRAREAAREGYQWTAECVQRTSQENPLLMGLVALGIGAGVAMLLPETTPERRVMGETRDRVFDQAQRRIQQAGQKATEAAQEAMNTVQQTVQEKLAA